MSEARLCLHRGGRIATREEVCAIEAPPPTDTWFPLPHGRVLAQVEALLAAAQYAITRERLALSHHGNRFFAVLDLQARITDGVGLVLGLRNSIDKSFPYGIAGGTRTFICDNLALTGDWSELTISRKHTRFGEFRFTEAIAHGLTKLDAYRAMEQARFETMRRTPLSDTEAYALFLRAFERNLLSHRVLRAALQQWNAPGYDWGPPSLFRLYQAMTTPLQPRAISNPQAFSAQTMRLMELVAPRGGDQDRDVTPRPSDAADPSGSDPFPQRGHHDDQ